MTQIAGAHGRNGLAEARRIDREREDEAFHRLPHWWDADGWAAYRQRHDIPALDTNYDD